MKTYRQLWDDVLTLLRSKEDLIGIPADKINAGKYREAPSSAPFLWIYMEPGDFVGISESHSGDGIATIMIFVGMKPAMNSMEANIAGHDVAATVVQILVQSALPFLWGRQPISLDEISTLYTAYRIETTAPYSLTEE